MYFILTPDCTVYTRCPVCTEQHKKPLDNNVVWEQGVENLSATVREARKAAAVKESIPCYDCQTYFQPEHDTKDIRCHVCAAYYEKGIGTSRGGVVRKSGVEPELAKVKREAKVKKE